MGIRIPRDWATPLTIGAFALMASTGALMFFHLDSHLQKEIHEWAGWVMVAGVGLHAAANWPGLKRYFQRAHTGRWVVAAFATVVLGTFVLRIGGGGEAGVEPPALAINALGQAPIAQVAPLFGKTAAQARADLAEAGIALASDEATLAGALGADRGRMGRALRVLSRRS